MYAMWTAAGAESSAAAGVVTAGNVTTVLIEIMITPMPTIRLNTACPPLINL
jgi:hypothetical protein